MRPRGAGIAKVSGCRKKCCWFHTDRLEAALAQLRAALEESVKLQSHYANSLNVYDAGQRIRFKNADDWLARLAMTPEERVEDAIRRAPTP